MNKVTIQKIITGIFAVCLLGWAVYALFLKPESGMNIVVESTSVAGLEPDNAVVANGLKIGTVKSMHLKQDFSGKVIINLLITQSDLNFPDSTTAIITDADLMGTKQLNLIYSNNIGTNRLKNNDTIYSELGSYFDKEISELEPLMTLIEQTYETLDTAVKSWKQQNLGDYDTKAREAERDIKEMIANFNTAMNGGKKLMKNATNSFERISKDAEIVMANFEDDNLRKIQANVATIQANMDKADFQQTSKNVENAMSQWNSTLENINKTKEIYTAIIKKLEAGSTGSLAQILNDPRFQSDTNNTEPLNLNYAKLLEDIRLHPEKYTYLLGKK
ncbi:MAG: MCE family protein [Saprospiraceae bacterium]|nr:MCE family protein [Saprospiraceae bacterium]